MASWIFHSGGPKVLQAVEKGLQLAPDALQASYNSLKRNGNLSSASVLTVLQDFLQNNPGKTRTYALMGALGPAFCSELLLLRWW